MEPYIRIEGLQKSYPGKAGPAVILQNINLEIAKGEFVCLIGHSGCGKSTLLNMVGGLTLPTGGTLELEGHPVKAVVPNLGYVFQNYSLLPWLTVYQNVFQAVDAVNEFTMLKEDEALPLVHDILEDLGIEPSRMGAFPHQLSGGMRQRIMIGLGLVLRPKLVICDEPTTALDVIVEAGFIDLLKRLKTEFNLTVVVITHNLGLVAELADRIAVMYAGQVVENATAEAVFHEPLHPYTQGLISCVPNIDLDQEKLTTMEGSPPGLVDPPKGCAFAPRCPLVMGRCRVQEPELKEHRSGHLAACWRISDSEDSHGR